MAYSYISTSTTTQVVSQSAKLNRLVISSMAAGSTIDIYDATSGTTNPVFSLVAADWKGSPIEFKNTMQNGIRVITAGATPPKLLVVYNEE